MSPEISAQVAIIVATLTDGEATREIKIEQVAADKIVIDCGTSEPITISLYEGQVQVRVRDFNNILNSILLNRNWDALK